MCLKLKRNGSCQLFHLQNYNLSNIRKTNQSRKNKSQFKKIELEFHEKLAHIESVYEFNFITGCSVS